MKCRLVLAVAAFMAAAVAANIHLDPSRDPVRQRLDIPAQMRLDSGDNGRKSSATGEPKQRQTLKRLWGIPDATAEAGQVFDLTLPRDAFEGHVSRYEVSGRDGKPLPPWLVFDAQTATLRGDPSPRDVGRWTVQVDAFGATAGQTARDVFAIRVVDAVDRCRHLTLCLTLDVDARQASSERRSALRAALSHLMGVAESETETGPARVDQPADWVRAGTGDDGAAASWRRRHRLELRTRLACAANDDDAFWAQWKRQAAGGQLARALGAPILDWHLTADRSVDDYGAGHDDDVDGRSKRQAFVDGSGDSDSDEEYDEDDNDIDDDDDQVVGNPSARLVPSLVSPVYPAPTTRVADPALATLAPPAVTATPALVAARPTDGIEPTPVLTMPSVLASVTPSTANDYNSSSSVDAAAEATPTSLSPLELPDVDPSENELENYDDDDDEKPAPSPPQVTRRLPRVTAMAGKIFRFSVPVDTFTDADGTARSLDLELIPADGKTLDEIIWIAFDADAQEVYGLPLADDIGKWVFTLQARNSANLTAGEVLEIQVWQHKAERTFHHHFRLQIEPEFSDDEKDLPRAHWMLKIVTGLAKVIGDVDTDAVVVRNVSGVLENSNSFLFSWSNSSLSRQLCPEDEIQDIYDKLYSRENDEVTVELDDELVPQLSVTLVEIELEGICKPLPTAAPTAPTEAPSQARPKVKANTAPSIPNPVDQLEVTQGTLFRYQVPEDTFHDEEDGATRMLNLNLLDISRQPLDPHSWLQFDVPNQEFYGLPLEADVGTQEYQLRCVDSGGLSSYDGLVVVVNGRPAASESPTVEFKLSMDVEFESLANSAHRKARLVDALALLFNDTDARHIVVRSFGTVESGVDESEATWTSVTWENATLHSSLHDGACPQEAILALRRVLLDDDGVLTARAVDVLNEAGFDAETASLTPLGVCIGEFTPTHGPAPAQEPATPTDVASNVSWTDDYLLTFIVPGIIITVMLLMAAVIACVLYRRRRTGKLGLEERRGFVSKGIPIIFAEELEERPSSRHPAKAPVILKEEKPAQSPPDYHKVRSSASPTRPHNDAGAEQRDLLRSPSDEAGDDDEPAGLYQPPPPLSSTSTGRNSRPKATPAYRKPPPYVPP